jgi:hypothetical protein
MHESWATASPRTKQQKNSLNLLFYSPVFIQKFNNKRRPVSFYPDGIHVLRFPFMMDCPSRGENEKSPRLYQSAHE